MQITVKVKVQHKKYGYDDSKGYECKVNSANKSKSKKCIKSMAMSNPETSMVF